MRTCQCRNHSDIFVPNFQSYISYQLTWLTQTASCIVWENGRLTAMPVFFRAQTLKREEVHNCKSVYTGHPTHCLSTVNKGHSQQDSQKQKKKNVWKRPEEENQQKLQERRQKAHSKQIEEEHSQKGQHPKKTSTKLLVELLKGRCKRQGDLPTEWIRLSIGSKRSVVRNLPVLYTVYLVLMGPGEVSCWWKEPTCSITMANVFFSKLPDLVFSTICHQVEALSDQMRKMRQSVGSEGQARWDGGGVGEEGEELSDLQWKAPDPRSIGM